MSIFNRTALYVFDCMKMNGDVSNCGMCPVSNHKIENVFPKRRLLSCAIARFHKALRLAIYVRLDLYRAPTRQIFLHKWSDIDPSDPEHQQAAENSESRFPIWH